MAFSPEVYGLRASSALNALAARIELRDVQSVGYRDFRFHTITQPEGTFLEADLLLSCSGVRFSPVFRLLNDYNHDWDEEDEIYVDFTRPFVRDYTHFSVMVSCFQEECNDNPSLKNEFRRKIMSVLACSVLEFRKSIRAVFTSGSTTQATTRGPVFSDSLFGPYVARVLNELLAIEIRLSDADPRLNIFPTHFRSYFESVTADDAHNTFALQQPEKGTAFAGDMLVLQYSLSRDPGNIIIQLKEKSGPLLDALFPEFHRPDTPLSQMDADEFNQAVSKALDGVRAEMDFVFRIIHGPVVTTLMAGNRRLGKNSPLGALETEVLCMIARMVI